MFKVKRTLVLTLSLVCSVIPRLGQLHAHELPEHRSIIVSISAETIEMLVLYELPAGVDAMSYRTMIDLDRNGVVEGELENLAQAQVLLPRIGTGLTVTSDDEPVELGLADVSFQEGAGDGPDQGFIAVAIFSGPFEITTELRITLTIGMEIDPVHAEMQVTGDVQMTESSHPVAPDAPVIGPAELGSGEAMWVGVRWP